MKYTTYVTSKEDLQRVLNAAAYASIDEVLLAPRMLSHLGTLREDETQALAQEAQEAGLRPTLVWDLLMPERSFQQATQRLQTWDWSSFCAIRASDPGVAWWAYQELPTLPLQLSVEQGNHNTHALEGWCELLSPRLARLILSTELPEEKLIELCQKLPVPCEIKGVGRILLFHSPRSLLTQHLKTDTSQPLQTAVIRSEDSGNRPFPLVESSHGTQMFLDKDQFLLDRLDGLREAGLHTVRLDLRHVSEVGHTASRLPEIIAQAESDPEALRQEWPRKTRAPFFRANRTTAQFGRMRSKTHAVRGADCLAEVLATQKAEYVVAKATRDFSIEEAASYYLPSGESLSLMEDVTFQTPEGEPLTTLHREQLFLLSWQKKICTGALLRADTQGAA